MFSQTSTQDGVYIGLTLLQILTLAPLRNSSFTVSTRPSQDAKISAVSSPYCE
jgi:hypothetical protein